MLQINMLLFEGLTQLDLTGPYEVLVRVPGVQVNLVAKTLDCVKSDRGLVLKPTHSIDYAPEPDILVVPGGPGVDDTLEDQVWIDFVKQQAAKSSFVFGICTGSLLLGAAGLLIGKRATCHWQAREFLSSFGAIGVAERMVQDGNLFTAGGVTSGIDMALLVVGKIFGDEVAEQIQLQIEYDPMPPYPGGTPFSSKPVIVDRCRTATAKRWELRSKAVKAAASNLFSV